MRHEIGIDSWTDFGTNTVDVVAVAKAYNRVVVDDVVAGDGVAEWGSSLLRISVNLLVDVVKVFFGDFFREGLTRYWLWCESNISTLRRKWKPEENYVSLRNEKAPNTKAFAAAFVRPTTTCLVNLGESWEREKEAMLYKWYVMWSSSCIYLGAACKLLSFFVLNFVLMFLRLSLFGRISKRIICGLWSWITWRHKCTWFFESLNIWMLLWKPKYLLVKILFWVLS